jgi:predicted DNA-binding transcriptional regulator AlpA
VTEWADVLSIDEVAERIGHTPNYTAALARLDDFPEPRKVVGAVRLWDAADVRQWAEARDDRRAKHAR